VYLKEVQGSTRSLKEPQQR